MGRLSTTECTYLPTYASARTPAHARPIALAIFTPCPITRGSRRPGFADVGPKVLIRYYYHSYGAQFLCWRLSLG